MIPKDFQQMQPVQKISTKCHHREEPTRFGPFFEKSLFSYDYEIED